MNLLQEDSNLLLNTGKAVNCSCFGFNIKVEGPEASSATGEVYAGDLVEADVNRRLVNEDEASL